MCSWGLFPEEWEKVGCIVERWNTCDWLNTKIVANATLRFTYIAWFTAKWHGGKWSPEIRWHVIAGWWLISSPLAWLAFLRTGHWDVEGLAPAAGPRWPNPALPGSARVVVQEHGSPTPLPWSRSVVWDWWTARNDELVSDRMHPRCDSPTCHCSSYYLAWVYVSLACWNFFLNKSSVPY